jgi:hypothetical protein
MASGEAGDTTKSTNWKTPAVVVWGGLKRPKADQHNGSWINQKAYAY